MNRTRTATNGLIGAERRRQIHNWVLDRGSVGVTELAKALGVGPETIRRDLDELDRQGKLIRSYGGAIAKDVGGDRLPYSQVRGEHMAEKAWIGAAALDYLPATGVIFLGGGTTVHQLAVRIPEERPVEVVTPSPETGLYLVTKKNLSVSILGGKIHSDTLNTLGEFSEETTDVLLYDVVLLGVSAIDIRQGITSTHKASAAYERKVIEHGRRVVLLSDSSKLGRVSYVIVGPIDMVDVLVTDQNADPNVVDEIRKYGVEVVIAGPSGGEQ